MVYSYELEQHLIAGLIKYPESYPLIAPFIDEKDFFDQNTIVNKTIFCVLRQSLDQGESLDEVILTQRVQSLNISFEDNFHTNICKPNVSVKMKAQTYPCVVLSNPVHSLTQCGTLLIHQKDIMDTKNCNTHSVPNIRTVVFGGIGSSRSARYIKSFLQRTQEV